MLEFFEKGPVLIVLLLGILIFGSSRLPGAARSLGQSMRILKAETKGLKDDEPTVAKALPAAPPTVTPTVEAPAPSTETPHQT